MRFKLHATIIHFLAVLLLAGIADASVLLTEEERAWLDAHASDMVLAFDPYFPPVEFLTPEGQFDGLAAGVIQLVEDRLGVTFAKDASTSWVQQIKDLKNGTVAMLPAMVRTPEREEYAYFCIPYVEVPVVVITNSRNSEATGLESFAGKRVAVVKGYVTEQYIRENYQGVFNLVLVDNVQEGLRDVSFGVVEAMVENLAVAAYYLDQEKLPNLRVAGNTGLSYKLSIAVSKQYPLLFTAVHKAMEDVSEKELQGLHDQWVALEHSHHLTDRQVMLLQAVAVAVLIVILGLGLFSWLLKRRLRSKESSLRLAEQSLEEKNERLQLVMASTRTALWDLYPKTGTTWYSDEWFTMLGYEPGEFEHTYKAWAALTHPEDADIVDEVLRVYFQNKGEGVYEAEFRMRTKGGGWRWILGKGQVVEWDNQGEPYRLLGMNVDINRVKQAQQALLDSEERYRATLDNSPMGMHIYELVDDRLIIIAANPAAHRLMHTDRRIMGMSLEEAFPALKDTIYPQRYNELTQGGPPWNFEYIRHDTAGDLALAFSITAFHISPGRMVVFFMDIKQQYLAEQQLRQSEEKFSTLFRFSPDNLVLIEFSTQAIADVNEAFAHRAGIPREAMIGHTFPQLGIIMDEEAKESFYRNILEKGSVTNVEAEFRNDKGEIGTYSVSGTIVEIGGTKYLLAIGRDITDMKRMQQVMVQTEKMLSVGGIAAGVAHEINNPLGIVLQAAQNLEQRSRVDFPKNIQVAEEVGLDLERMAEYMRVRKLDVFIQDIRNAAQRASTIIRHMLNFSRRSESRRAVCDLTSIIEGALALARSDYDLKKSYDFKKIHVEISIEDNLPPVNCTETEIEQVVLNLLRNAAQALSELDPPREDPRIDIRVKGHEGWVHIEVEDNGPGIPDDVQKRIMEPFFTTKEPGVGTGLGLSVSYFIITNGHEGKFTVSSTPGKGTLFTIDLPTEQTRGVLQ